MNSISDFKTFGLPNELVQALDQMGISTPTPIQAKSIPPTLEGYDLLASAQTGSGKTFAYGLPLIVNLINKPGSTSLVLAPTRELATQVKDSLLKLLNNTLPLKVALLIGGDSMFKQLTQLKALPRLIIGTPGRVFDHLKRKSLKLEKTSFLVVDEADRMLDMGFSVQLDQIAQYLPRVRQTLMFSATIPPSIERLTERYLNNPKRISVDSTTRPAANIKQEIVHTSAPNKFTHLLKELNTREGSIIVFVKTKRGAEQLAIKLERENQSVGAIHGDLRQNKRDRVIQNFRNSKNRIMVATDIAARGLDIPHVRHVINYDLPQCPEDYIHRIGRTARAGMDGSALCLISPEDSRKWKAIHRLINPGKPMEEGPRGERGSRDSSSSRGGFGDRKRSGFRTGFSSSSSSGERGRKRFTTSDEKRTDESSPQKKSVGKGPENESKSKLGKFFSFGFKSKKKTNEAPFRSRKKEKSY